MKNFDCKCNQCSGKFETPEDEAERKENVARRKELKDEAEERRHEEHQDMKRMGIL